MRHFTLVFVMAVALLLAGGASALPSSGINPDTMCAATNPDHVPFVQSTVNGVAMPGATANFCLHYGELRGLLDSSLVNQCSDPAFASLCALLVPCISDINGTIIIDDRVNAPCTGSTIVTVQGNGIYDASNELAVLKRILTTPTFNNGVLTYATVLAAYENNFYQVQCDLNPQNTGGLSTVYPTPISGLVELIAAHLTIGDGALTIDTTDPCGNVTTAAGSWGVASGIVFLLCDFLPGFTGFPCINANIVKADYDILDTFLAANGDADGDGATNLQEAEWYTQASCGTVAPVVFPPNAGPFVTVATPPAKNYFVCPPATGTSYIDAALDPNLTPLPPSESFLISADPFFVEEGGDITLKVATLIPGLDLTDPSVTYQWRIGTTDLIGETSQTLSLIGVTTANNGLYICLVDYNAVDPPVDTKPYLMNVLPVGSVPVGGGLAMGLLAGVCALAGAMGIRRKN